MSTTVKSIMTRLVFKAPKIGPPKIVTADDIKRVKIAAALIGCGLSAEDAWHDACETVAFERMLIAVADYSSSVSSMSDSSD